MKHDHPNRTEVERDDVMAAKFFLWALVWIGVGGAIWALFWIVARGAFWIWRTW